MKKPGDDTERWVSSAELVIRFADQFQKSSLIPQPAQFGCEITLALAFEKSIADTEASSEFFSVVEPDRHLWNGHACNIQKAPTAALPIDEFDDLLHLIRFGDRPPPRFHR